MTEKRRQPFHTTDAILAFSLYLAGVPFYEERRPCINIYDENILRKLGFINVSIEDGVRKAISRKKKGHVEYGFERTPELQSLLQAYKDQEDRLQSDEGTAAEVVQRLAEQLKDGVNPFTIVRLACVILKMRVKFVSLWQTMEPLIRVFNEGEVQTNQDDGVTTRRFPGFRIVSLHASQKTKDKLKL